MILEYFDAVTLGDFIQKKGHLSEKETKVISKQLFNTIRYCHAKRIAHRDLKPENVLVNKNLEIKLIDFAFSVKLSSRKSQLKADCGTPNYMAPEVVSRKVCSPQKADIWALGVMMYKMRTGKLPFSGKTPPTLTSSSQKQAQPGETDQRLQVQRAPSRQFLPVVQRPAAQYPAEGRQ